MFQVKGLRQGVMYTDVTGQRRFIDGHRRCWRIFTNECDVDGETSHHTPNREGSAQVEPSRFDATHSDTAQR